MSNITIGVIENGYKKERIYAPADQVSSIKRVSHNNGEEKVIDCKLNMELASRVDIENLVARYNELKNNNKRDNTKKIKLRKRKKSSSKSLIKKYNRLKKKQSKNNAKVM